MKYLKNFLFVIFLSSFICVQTPKFDIIKFSKNFVTVKSGLLFCKYETSNRDYLFFLEDLKIKKKFDDYNKMYPDTLVWKRFDLGRPLIGLYFKSPSYYNYPVVGVSFDNAIAYCEWLTEKYNRNPNKKFKKVKFCLPENEEWVFAANAGDTSRIYAWDGPHLRNKKGNFMANFKLTDQNNEVIQTESEKTVFVNYLQKKMITSPVNSYYPGSFGLYNMCGNVSEMIAHYGFSKGGGFDDSPNALQINNLNKYANPEYNVGFRVAMRIIEK